MSKLQYFYAASIFQILVKLASSGQNAGYYCLSDSQSSDILHIDFQLDPANDTVNLVYAYESSNDTPLSGCHSEYDSTNKIHHLRITMNITTQQQVSPSSSCGSSFSAGVYTIKMRSFVSEDMISSSDRLYTIRCEDNIETHTMASVNVGSIDHITITGSTPTAKLEIVSVPDLTRLPSVYIGAKVRMKFTLTFTSAKENLDIIGARLKNLIVSPTDNYEPVNRTIIDENGCAVNHAETVLSVSGPFETTANGTTPFIAYSPEMEIARYSSFYGVLHFQIYAEYCYNVDCFATMCSTRKKRATDTAEPKVTVSQFSISVVNPYTQTESQTTCYSKTTFIAIISTISVLTVGGIVLVAIQMKKLTVLKSKISPSPDISFEKLPLCNMYYKNPVDGYHPPVLHNQMGRIVL